MANILIKSGKIVDPKSNTVKCGDLRIEGKFITEIGQDLSPKNNEKVIQAEGKIVMPGLVDMHMHISGSLYGQYMLARAGVTTALDMDTCSPIEKFVEETRKNGCGLNIAWLGGMVPETVLSSSEPDEAELIRVLDKYLKGGAIGVKILGGHRPLTRKTTAKIIELSHQRRSWVAFHTGTVETNGDIRGMLEAVELSNGNPLHIAHINSYCRGGVYSPHDEAKLAIDALKSAPWCRSESYLALFNGTSGACRDNGTPISRVTCNELRRGGYPASREGILAGIADGFINVNHVNNEKRANELITGKEGVELYKSGVLGLSFPANSPASSIPLALAKDSAGNFVVDALSTDGGRIPRNLTLHQGLPLVQFGAFTLPDFARKACYNPALLLGFADRGYLQEGAVADVIVVNAEKAVAEKVISSGEIICDNGEILGKDVTFVAGPRGEETLSQLGANFVIHQPEWLEGVPRSSATPCEMPKIRKTIGILGGLGPSATADLFKKIVDNTPAKKDQDHPHILIDDDTLIPDRTLALQGKGASPVPEMLAAARRLEAAGADFIAIPCNTAHAFLPELEPYVQIPFLNMPKCVVNYIQKNYPNVQKIGLLATSGTVGAGLYAKIMQEAHLELIVPDEHHQLQVMDAIYSPEYGIKAGKLEQSSQMLKNVGEILVSQGAQVVILGCTEIPLAIKTGDLSVPVIDTTLVLAQSILLQ